jgi:hypothetical protein
MKTSNKQINKLIAAESRYALRRTVESTLYLINVCITMCAVVGFIGGVVALFETTFTAVAPDPFTMAEIGVVRWTFLTYPWTVLAVSFCSLITSWLIQTGVDTGGSTYRYTTLMPTYIMNKCSYCTRELPNTINMVCHRCRRWFPLGAKISAIRMFGVALSIANYSLLATIIIFFVFACVIK